MAETVVILGASTNPGRFSHKAQLALLENGHTPVPVNPRYERIDGILCYPDLKSVRGAVDTVTVYVRPDILAPMIEDVVQMHPKRVIFNPGSECEQASVRFASAGIRVQNACTLVLLDSSRFTG
jgi:predicted CoA-binding protein